MDFLDFPRQILSRKFWASNICASFFFFQVQESNFTRTISNPDAVIKKRREQKVQKRLATESREIQIYTDLAPTLCYYVNVRVSPIDQVDRVVEAALSRLDIRDDPENYLIAKVSFAEFELFF